MIRPYETKDKTDCLRILKEVGWLEGKDKDGAIFDAYGSDSKAFVAELEGAAEVFAITRGGDCKYQEQDLPFSAVTGVITSRVARQQGLASKVTALAISESAKNGASMSLLGMFDQGYYEKFGYGSTIYTRHSTIDPASLNVPRLTRAPKRLCVSDAEAIHNCRNRRRRYHGGCNLHGAGETSATLMWSEGGFGLGFENESGELTHCMWIEAKGEHGPYSVLFSAWETHTQFIELLSVLKSLSDQVYGVRMADPPHMQLQDFLTRPIATSRIRKGGDFDSRVISQVWMQGRILDVPRCIGSMKCCGEPVSFTLSLTDPIEKYLPEHAAWQGVSGDWIVTIGPESSAVPGNDASLPSATATVNDLSRIWLGAASAEAVSVTGNFRADNSLVQQIDSLVQLPAPSVDWNF